MKSRQWLNNARFASWWLDFNDLSWPDRNLTAKWKQRAGHFQKHGVNAVVMTGFHFRWDYHSLFQRVFGALREIGDICHDHGMKVVEQFSATRVCRPRSDQARQAIRLRIGHHVPYYPDNWDHALYNGESMAGWRQISAVGEGPAFREQDLFTCFCPNNPGFQQASAEYIERHAAAVPADAVLVTDLEFLPDVYSCACGHCRKRFSAEAGIELPAADNHNFWENRENPDFLAWIGARYRWSSEHYQRLRKRMPPEVLLCGCASSCLEPSQAAIGFSPQHAAEHWDVIFYEISPVNGSGADSPDIATELVAFDSLARHQQKPLVALCHVNSPHELPRWLHRLQGCHARPWISKRIRRENPIPEEQLLASGYSFPKTQKPKPPPSGSAQAIIFSESFRDRLPPRQADNYVDQCRSLCHDLIARGSQPQFLFDSMWKAASPEPWDCLWTVDPRALDPERETKLQTWQDTGLAVGVA